MNTPKPSEPIQQEKPMKDVHQFGAAASHYGLENHGLRNLWAAWWNLPSPALHDTAVRNREGVTVHLGPLAVRTGQHTGRSPNDRFIVRESSTEDKIWWGKINRPFEREAFTRLKERMMTYLEGRQVFIQDCYAGADPDYRLPIRVVTETAWHNLFVRNMFIRELDREKLMRHIPEFTVIQVPSFTANPETDGTNSQAFIILNFAERMILIGGTAYAGEIKKSIFSVMNYLMPQRGVLPMHCSANMGAEGDVAIFFGLSGTGKTTLSADSSRVLIGDDEHGWSDKGIFNFEGGCYAKVINLSPEAEPEIYATTRRFGTILENVAYNAITRRIDLSDASLTENTRAAYPISHIPNASREGMAGHPKNVIFLTADAFGVLPPIARLTPEQAMYHFISGYTAKVAGTERGVTEPQPNFSACFGAPFLPLHPFTYARMLAERVEKYGANVWLVNTGWTGGPYGVGRRMNIGHTRAMVAAALAGDLDDVETRPHPVFGVHVPVHVPNVPDHILDPRNTWSDGAAYDEQARKLAHMFQENFKQFADEVSEKVLAAGPRL
ncbi:MAG: phosphoenolpyruvate carboxykinase [Caldilineae bacterium]|nr:MAG: phosphoenolpyruvate carboxykinase [Caldilineae bacterium]